MYVWYVFVMCNDDDIWSTNKKENKVNLGELSKMHLGVGSARDRVNIIYLYKLTLQ